MLKTILLAGAAVLLSTGLGMAKEVTSIGLTARPSRVRHHGRGRA